MPANTGSDGWGPSIFQMTVNICALVTQALGRVTLGKASGGRDEQAALGLAGVPLPLPSPPLPSLGASGTSVPARGRGRRKVRRPRSRLPRPAPEACAFLSLCWSRYLHGTGPRRAPRSDGFWGQTGWRPPCVIDGEKELGVRVAPIHALALGI